MRVTVKDVTSNELVVSRARITVGKEPLGKEPSEKFMNDAYMSEHSPIRVKFFLVQLKDIPSWVATHLARHHVGVEPFVRTQREDRVDDATERDFKYQGSLIDMDLVLNSQAFISISRKRCCGQSHARTQLVWNTILYQLRYVDPILAKHCVPECVYRGFCPEPNTCGRCDSDGYKKLRLDYVGSRPKL